MPGLEPRPRLAPPPARTSRGPGAQWSEMLEIVQEKPSEIDQVKKIAIKLSQNHFSQRRICHRTHYFISNLYVECFLWLFLRM